MDGPQQPGYGGFSQPGYPPQGGAYPPQGGAYPPQGGAYPPQGGAYPPPGFQQGGYPGPPPTGFVNPGYPDPNQGGYVPPGGGYPPPPMSGNYTGPGAPPPPMYMPDNPGGELGEDQNIKGFEFNDKSIRLAFIRKVYGILMCQLVVTFGFIAVCLLHDPTRLYVRNHPALWWIALVVMLVTLISMACCTTVRRKAPMNFIFLALFTFAEGFMLAMAASSYNSQEVLLAVGITAVVCLSLTLFAFQTRWDFTKMGGVLLVLLVVLMLFGIISLFYRGKTMTLVYASLGAIVFSFYLLYDTQLMMGGNHKFSISPEEYIFAALNLYLDVINIFLYILTIIGASRD